MQRSWNRWSTVLYLLVIVLLLSLVVAAGAMNASAQEATVTPDGPPVVVLAPEETISNVNTIVLGFVLAFVAGGATVSGALMVFAKRLRDQPELARAIERLYMSVPADKQQVVRKVIVAGKEGFDLAEDLTDGDLNSPSGGAG